MLAQYFTPTILIALAGGIQMFGYLLINQVHLRLTMICSTTFYILYYFSVAETPLWFAIGISTMTIVTILIGLAALYARNASWSIPEDHRDIYPLFDELQPGDFRKMMRLAQRVTLDEDRIVTTEGQAPDHLYFVISGTFAVQKGKIRFDVPGPTFIGEVAYLLGTDSAATTTLPKGTEVLIWSRVALQKQDRSAPRRKLALEAIISRDLATKVSHAVSPDAEHS